MTESDLQIGKLYYNTEQECVVKLFEIDHTKHWPYKYDLPDGDGTEGNHYDASWTDELWDKEDILEEIESLKSQIKEYRKVIKELDKGNK